MLRKNHGYAIVRVILLAVLMLGNLGVHPVHAATIGFGWTQRVGGPFYDFGSAIAIDNSGNVYTTGGYDVSSDNGDIFINKLDGNGSIIWSKIIGGTASDAGDSIAVDDDGNVYTLGSFNSSVVDFDPGVGISNLIKVGSSDIFISKLDENGNFLWAKSIGGPSHEYYGAALAVDDGGNIYITGRYSDTLDFDPGVGISNLTSTGSIDIFISKLDSNGNFLWAKSMGGVSYDESFDIAVDGTSNIVTTGYFHGTADFDPGAGTSDLISAGGQNLFISKLDSNGNFVWAKSAEGTGGINGMGIALDSSGNVYTTGAFINTVYFNLDATSLTSVGSGDIFISKLDVNGNFVWAKSMGGTSDDLGYDIAVDGNGDVYATGEFRETINFDSATGISSLVSAGYNDIFICKLDNNGNFVWAESLGGELSEISWGIAVDHSNIYAIGDFSGTVDFDPGSGTRALTSAGQGDVFISKLTLGTTVTISGNTGVGLTSLDYSFDGHTTSDENGNYSIIVPVGWTGQIHPDKPGYQFTPPYRDYSALQVDQQNQDFIAERIYTISGNVGMSGVTLSYIENDILKTTVSYGSGFYSFEVHEHWSGTVVPSKTDYIFVPASRSYTNVQEDQTFQDYTAIQTRMTISGNVRHGGVTLSYVENDVLKTVTSDSSGNYSLKVDVGWSGVITPARDGVIFDPINKSYLNVQSNQTAQNYKASIPVDTSADSGPGSLRDAIFRASYGDLITFHPDLAGQTITLASTLSIGKGLTINGSGLNPRVEINGNGEIKIFGVSPRYDPSGPPTVKFQSLILKNGKGAMEIGGGDTLIENVSFIDNSSYNGGAISICCTNTTVRITGSKFESNSAQHYGGAIHAQSGRLTVQSSTFTNNSSGSVGGAISIEREGPYTLEDNTFSNNSALSGGAIRFEAVEYPIIVRGNLFSGNNASLNGGAIFELLYADSFTIENNTFFGNQANNKGGAVVINSVATLKNNTFSENKSAPQSGGSLYLGHAYLYNNILANNAGGGECYVNTAGWVIGGHNLIEDASANCGTMITGDPMLGPLTDNGGFTQTMALGAGSPAIDAGDDANCPATDQRGVARPLGGHCDIGGYESNFDGTPPNAPIVTVPVGFINDTTPTISGTAEANSLVNVWYRDNSNSLVKICNNVAADGSGNWSCDSSVTLPERAIQLTVRATDAAGNMSNETTHSFTVDLTAPAAPVVNAPTGITNDSTPTISGTAEANSLVNVWYINDNDAEILICTNAVVNGSGDWSCTSSVTLPERLIELVAKATDAAGNESDDGTYSFTIDLIAPAAPVVTAPIGTVNDATPTISGTAEANSKVNVMYNLVSICVHVPVNGAGIWSCEPSASLQAGSVELKVTATDAAGNTSADTTHSFTIKLSAPTVMSIVRVGATPTSAANVDFIVTFSEDVIGISAIDFSLHTTGNITGASVSGVTGSGSSYTVSVNTGTKNGALRLDVPNTATITDLAGNGLSDLPFTVGAAYTIFKTNGPDTTGVFRPSNGLLYLKNTNDTGFADVAINYGMGGDYPVVGDWDGNGTVTIGIYRNGKFYLRNENSLGFADMVFAFGIPGDQPIAGDWDGDGIDTIGVYRSSIGLFLLRNSNAAGDAEMSFYLGNPGDVGIAGDWDADGLDTTGVFRPSNGVIFLKNANNTGYADIALNYGLPGDQPVMGDWNNDGIDTIGIYRNSTFYLRNSNTNGFADIVFSLGIPGDIPIAGNWDGSLP